MLTFYKKDTMRTKYFSFLIFLLLAGAGNASAQQTIVFDATSVMGHNANYSETTQADSMSLDGITIKSTDAAFATGTSYRIYSGASLTVSSVSGNIRQIEFYCAGSGTQQYGPGNLTRSGNYSSGEYSASGKKGIWKGNAESVTFNRAIAQVRANKIEVTLEQPSAVESISYNNSQKNSKYSYNIMGQKVAKYQGIMIRQGRKFYNTNK